MPPLRKSFAKLLSLEAIIFCALSILFAGYTAVVVHGLSGRWFNPNFATDDSLHQSFFFHEVWHPGLFANDFAAPLMRTYLPPVHYWLGYGITILTADPIMTGHWMMLMQILLTVAGIFFAVKNCAGFLPAIFSALWFIHTEPLIGISVGGLARGWAGPVSALFLWAITSDVESAVLLSILFGCTLHPPSALVAAASYGFVLLIRSASTASRSRALRLMLHLATLSPVFISIVYFEVRMPKSVGTMATLERAVHMPGFSKAGGRFLFLPFDPALSEIRDVGFQSIASDWKELSMTAATIFASILIVLFGELVFFFWLNRRRHNFKAFSLLSVVAFGLNAILLYLLARAIAFRLYVPERYLESPFGVFFIVLVPALLGTILTFQDRGKHPARSSLLLQTQR